MDRLQGGRGEAAGDGSALAAVISDALATGSDPVAAARAEEGPRTDGSVTVTVTLRHCRYASPPDRAGRSPFAVWTVAPASGLPFTARGRLADWGRPGDVVRLVGRWVDDPRYGRQLEVEAVLAERPADLAGLAKWLEQQDGIGPGTSAAVAAALRDGRPDGGDILDRFRAWVGSGGPDGLGLPEPRKAALRRAAERAGEEEARARALIWCRRAGLGPAAAEAVWREFGPEALDVLPRDPWALTRVDGIGFLTADAAAQALGVDPAADGRLRAALLHTLADAAEEDGHLWLPADGADGLVRRAFEVLRRIAEKRGYGKGLGGEILERLPGALESLITRGEAIAADIAADAAADAGGGRIVYLPPLYDAEKTVRAWLWGAALRPGLVDEGQAREILEGPAVRGRLDDAQAEAVVTALSAGVSVITGPPGVGKTTVILTVLRAAEAAGVAQDAILLAAPTGRAAKRMADVTGHPAQTIHRLLEFHPQEGFRRNNDAPLDGRMLIVDEASMVDARLFAALVAAVPPRMPVVLVGDRDQLPPVGPGAPFHVLARGGVPGVRMAVLDRIYRQDAGSAIPRNAVRIRQGLMPEEDGGPAWRVRLYARPRRKMPRAEWDEAGRALRRRMADDAVEAVRTLVLGGLSPDDVQVLAPIRRGEAGVDELNRRLRDVLNPLRPGMGVWRSRSGATELREGDRVIHVRNDYRKGVMNGEVGRVVAAGRIGLDEEGHAVWWSPDADGHPPAHLAGEIEELIRGVVVEYPDYGGGEPRAVPYAADEVGDLRLAYASTVHKFQGSEVPAVVFVVGMDAFTLLKRPLVYTAVTRARDRALVLAEEGALERA
ncbi:MAG: AAA family ATPase, partial [Bacillota bacterium]|nr:AAA family ATPase [Bacillota bacterium]